jgi:outer membrane protein
LTDAFARYLIGVILPAIKKFKMRNFSLGLNIILVIAVAFLYYHAFAGKKSAVSKSSATIHKDGATTSEKPLIAYVDLDSLNARIVFIKEKRKQLEAEQKAIETEWQAGYRGLENQKNNFLKKGNAITQQMAEEFQGQLIQQQQEIDSKKQNLSQRLSEKSYKFLDDIQKKLKTFLVDYNKEKDYKYILTTGTGLDYMVFKDSTLNITEDVIKGMNEKLKSDNK